MMANEQEKAGVPAGERSIVFLTTVDGAKFRRPVRPGDQLRTEATLVRFRGKVGKMKFVCTVDGEVAAEAVTGFVSGTTLTAQPEQD
jgi:3-hydroxymyristoyl/3-hydroxydecanoyl-(acyl carrier protein) dehydratase